PRAPDPPDPHVRQAAPQEGEAQHGAGDELPAQRGNLSPASLALVIVHGLAHHFKWLVASLAHRSTQIGHRRRRDRLDGRALDGHGLFDDIDAVGPILDHPGHAPHVSLDAAQADGGLGPNVRGAMLEVDLGHRHTAPPPTLPPPLWGGVRPIIASPRGFRIAILPGDASYRETPITCTSRAATVPSPLACPTITTRSLACSAAQDARKPWNRVVALLMM